MNSVQEDKLLMVCYHCWSWCNRMAICEGYIDNINVKLNDWPLIQNTLYQDSILLDLLNMKGGDQKWV